MNKIYLAVSMSFFSIISFAQKEVVFDSTAYHYAQSITASDLSKHLHIIASDEYEGRETGKKGQKMAAEYIKKEFEQYGLEPIGDGNSYFQHFEMTNYKTTEITISTKKKNFSNWSDFVCLKRNFESIELQNTEIIFLGNGDLENYKNIDVENKIVLIVPKTALETDELLEIAYHKRAKFVFTISKNVEHFLLSEDIKHYVERDKLLFSDEKKESFNTSLSITMPMAADLLRKSKSRLEKEFDKSFVYTNETVLKGVINFKIGIEKTIIKTENVVGLLSADSSNEVIVLSAHYDHIGMDGDTVYNGADDDGSGTVTLLEMAQAFTNAKKNGFSPKRNILFIAMTGEEKGLLGSEYYSKHPLFPLENTIANLNTDMIGRVDEFHKEDSNYVYLIGTDMISKELHQISENVNTIYSNLFLDYRYNSLDDPNQFYYRSDHYNFAKNGVPVIFYFTGVHEDYHKPTDTVDKIMFEKTERIARLIFYTTWELANRSDRLEK